MAIYVGKNVNVILQCPIKDENETSKVMAKHNFFGMMNSITGSHEAYHYASDSEPTPPFGTEIMDSDYEKIAQSDNNRYNKSVSVNGQYAMMLFRYKVEFDRNNLRKLVVRFEGYGTAPAGNGMTMKIWDFNTSSWDHAVYGTGGSDETLTITQTSGLADHVNTSGYAYVLVRTANPSDGSTAAVLYCDYADCFVAQAQFTVDFTPVSDLDQDGVADEPEHVVVMKNGVAVTVSSVTDSSGLVVLASGDFEETDDVRCSYRYDASPYVAQEFTVEPKQHVEGVDGLGSDTVQLWAPVLKEVSGSIKEVLKPDGSQLQRMQNFRGATWTEDFGGDLSRWQIISGNWVIDNGELKNTTDSEILSKEKIDLGNFDYTFKWKLTNAIVGSTLRAYIKYSDTNSNYYFAFQASGNAVGLYKAGALKQSASFDYYINATYYVRIKVANGNIKLYMGSSMSDMALKIDWTDSSPLASGKIGFKTSSSISVRIDDIAITPIPVQGDDYGVIASYSQNGQTIKIGLDKVVFPEGSIPTPKNAPVYIVTPFKAQTIKTIT